MTVEYAPVFFMECWDQAMDGKRKLIAIKDHLTSQVFGYPMPGKVFGLQKRFCD